MIDIHLMSTCQLILVVCFNLVNSQSIFMFKFISLFFIVAVMFSIPGWSRKDGAKDALKQAEICVDYNVKRYLSYSHCFN